MAEEMPEKCVPFSCNNVQSCSIDKCFWSVFSSSFSVLLSCSYMYDASHSASASG